MCIKVPAGGVGKCTRPRSVYGYLYPASPFVRERAASSRFAADVHPSAIEKDGMTSTVEAAGENRQMSIGLHRMPRPWIIVGIYTAAYVALDRISWVQVLPDAGFTLWNPPPACSLALLLTRGSRFAPALFPAAVIADGLTGGFAVGVMPTLAMDAIIAAGYATVAVALRPFICAPEGLQNVRGMAWFLGIVCIGALAIAGAVGVMLTVLGILPPERLLAAVRHFWVGDITGIVGLLPVLMTAPLAWKRWRELPAHMQLVDPGVFVLALASALWIVFGAAGEKEFQFFYLLLLPTIWIGARHGLPWCAIAILIEQAALITVVTRYEYPLSDVTDFQLLALAIAATGLMLGTAVSERQQSELHLRQQQAEISRMARVTTAGALGTTIVHEISQPLATLATYAHTCRLLLRLESQGYASLSETLLKLEAEALRAGEIVERLREFVARGEARLARLDLVNLVREVVAALADEARANRVDVHVEAHNEISAVADRVQMEQVLVNLLRNAIEAAASGEVKEKRVRIRLSQLEGVIQIDIEDNGPGIPPDIAEHLFEPFVTQKSKGLGLGLLLSREIIKGHGGDLWCDHTVELGGRFTFRLPGDGSNVNG
jgi:two-component system sensor kinase FixL